jgi:hypothetical protein
MPQRIPPPHDICSGPKEGFEYLIQGLDEPWWHVEDEASADRNSRHGLD